MENKEEKQRFKRYNMYDQMNINEKWLDVFIIAMIVLLVGVVIWGSL